MGNKTRELIRFLVWLTITIAFIAFVSKINSQSHEFKKGSKYTVYWHRTSGGVKYENDIYFKVYSQSASIGVMSNQTADSFLVFTAGENIRHWVTAQYPDLGSPESSPSNTVSVTVTEEEIPPVPQPETQIPYQARAWTIYNNRDGWTGNSYQGNGETRLSPGGTIQKAFNLSGGTYNVDLSFAGLIYLNFGDIGDTLASVINKPFTSHQFILQAGTYIFKIKAISQVSLGYGIPGATDRADDVQTIRIEKITTARTAGPPDFIQVKQ